MSGSRVLVTGATGNVGREVVAASLTSGLVPTAAVRDPAKVTLDVDTVVFDFHKQATWKTALTEQDLLFLVRPPAIADVDKNLNPFIEQAQLHGIEHIVFLSVEGADRNRFLPHARVEKYLAKTNVSHTNLRPGFFAQNLQDAYRKDILEDDRIFVPAGRAKVNWIDVRDIAEVAAMIFQDPVSHKGAGYPLTGPGPVSWSHVTGVLSEVTGRRIQYKDAFPPSYILHLRRRGLPIGAIVVQTILHTLLRFGKGAFQDPTLKQLLNRPPRNIETYIRDHAKLWKS